MKVLILSDSHGAEGRLIRAIEENMDARILVFLGDGERDFENALAYFNIAPYGKDDSKIICQVCGNCDIYSREPVNLIASMRGIRVMITHGYDQGVKGGPDRLCREAARRNCRIALFGHTHSRHLSEQNGVILFNPGSVRAGSYGILTIENGEAEFSWNS